MRQPTESADRLKSYTAQWCVNSRLRAKAASIFSRSSRISLRLSVDASDIARVYEVIKTMSSSSLLPDFPDFKFFSDIPFILVDPYLYEKL